MWESWYEGKYRSGVEKLLCYISYLYGCWRYGKEDKKLKREENYELVVKVLYECKENFWKLVDDSKEEEVRLVKGDGVIFKERVV